MQQRLLAIVVGCLVFVACGVEEDSLAASSVPSDPVDTTAGDSGPTTSVAQESTPPEDVAPPDEVGLADAPQVATSEPAVEGGIEAWIVNANIDVLARRDDGGVLRSWLLRVDEDRAIELARALAIESHRYGISDEQNLFEAMRNDLWLRDCPACVQMNLEPDVALDFAINGGLFGERNPNPSSPEGNQLAFSSFAGELGSEPPDQIQYLVGSALASSMWEWETAIVEALPELSATEFIAAIQFAGTQTSGAG